MKDDSVPSFHYSPYPLRVIEESASAGSEPTPHMRALFSSKSTKPANPIRVYQLSKQGSGNQQSRPRPGIASNVEPDGKDWFTNYE